MGLIADSSAAVLSNVDVGVEVWLALPSANSLALDLIETSVRLRAAALAAAAWLME